LEILVQKELSQPLSRKVFAEFSTETLTLEDVVHALSEIIDDEKEGYHLLPSLGSFGESVERLDIYTSLRKRRVDRAYTISNGKNTIYILDYLIKTKKIYHDPVICIIGPDAEIIASKVLNNLKRMIVTKLCDLKINDAAVSDFSRLTKKRKMDVYKVVSDVLEETEVAIKMKLLDEDDLPKSNVKSGEGKVSKQILEDMKTSPLPHTPILDISEITPLLFIVIFVLVMILTVLMRLL